MYIVLTFDKFKSGEPFNVSILKTGFESVVDANLWIDKNTDKIRSFTKVVKL
jgi:hypothetical protein